jgi:hypothetical protein
MIDFSNATEELNSYKGSEKKKTLIYNNKKYLVKFPDPIREKNKNISYINNAFSEYVGSNIFKITGFETQNTLLGIYRYNEKEKIVCACEDFTDENHVLYEFENLALSANPDKKIETEISDIMEVIEDIKKLTQMNIKVIDDIKEKFWDMFIIDSLIGNTDRHNGNWGILVNIANNEARFAPIYDCGSCLNPILDDEEMEKINNAELKNLAVNCYSCITENGKKINYMSYIGNYKSEDCNNAIIRIFPKIDILSINNFIDNISNMSSFRKDFYKNIIGLRYEILKRTYKNIEKIK